MARLRVGLDARGRTVPTELRAEAPLLMRVTGEDIGCGLAVHLVGGAAGPLSGDRLVFDLDVEPGARLTVRSVAASLAQPGRTGAAGSTAIVTAHAHAGAALDWWPEPVISVCGSDHTITTALDIAGDAHVRWIDEAVLGRHAELGGCLTLRQRISVDGAPVLRHTISLDPQRTGIGRQGQARVVVTAIEAGPSPAAASSIVSAGLRCARFPLGAACTAWIALTDDLDRARAALAELGLDRRASIGGRAGCC